MKKCITILVLVLTMIKTNGQETYYYSSGNKLPLTADNNYILIRLNNSSDESGRQMLLNKISLDVKYKLVGNNIYNEYFLLKLKDGYSADISDISNYLTQDYIASANLGYKHPEGGYEFISNEVILIVKDVSYDLNVVKNLLSQYNYANVKQNEINQKQFHVFLSRSNTLNALEIANSLYETGYFEVSTPNFFTVGAISSSPCPQSDPGYLYQWPLSGVLSDGTVVPDINICPAWTMASGSTVPVSVAIIDVGVDLTHRDLTGRFLPGKDFDDPIGDGSCGANQPHGTQMAGIIASNSGNSIDNTGVSLPNTKIIPIRAFEKDGDFDFWSVGGIPGAYFDDSHLSNSINWAYTNGADIINCSWNFFGSADHPVISAAISNAYTLGRSGLGCVIVTSTGNFYLPYPTSHQGPENQLWYPASNPNVIAVGMSNECDLREGLAPCSVGGISASQYASCYGNGLSLVAPGKDIETLSNMHPTDLHPDSYGADGTIDAITHMSVEGTSNSAAFVSGVASLMLSVNPCMYNFEVKNVLEYSADKVGGYSYSTSTSLGSWDPEMGYGRLNAGNAVTFSHDIYKQNKTETSSTSTSYGSAHQILAGANVTSIIPMGNYIVGAGALINFYAPENINLEPGFEADNGSVFLADIRATCMGLAHWKQAENNIDNQAKNGSQPIDLNDNIKIYPNPTHDLLNVSYSLSKNDPVVIDIINTLGQKIYENTYAGNAMVSEVKTLFVSNLTPGNYFIIIKIGSEHHQFKFVKQ
jgi:hypothetical protein